MLRINPPPPLPFLIVKSCVNVVLVFLFVYVNVKAILKLMLFMGGGGGVVVSGLANSTKIFNFFLKWEGDPVPGSKPMCVLQLSE